MGGAIHSLAEGAPSGMVQAAILCAYAVIVVVAALLARKHARVSAAVQLSHQGGLLADRQAGSSSSTEDLLLQR